MNQLRLAMRRMDREHGMTLVEVVVAISILAILATASLGLYMSSMNASNSHQNRELAIAVANESLEAAVATPIDRLTAGRFKPIVDSQWNSTVNPATGTSVISALNGSYPLWDSGANASSTAVLPFEKTATLSGSEYSVQTFVARCYQPTGPGRASAGDCKRVAAHPNVAPAPSTTPSGTAPMFRVVVVVQWTSDDNCATAIVTNPCRYEVSTLLEPGTNDAEWVTSG